MHAARFIALVAAATISLTVVPPALAIPGSSAAAGSDRKGERTRIPGWLKGLAHKVAGPFAALATKYRNFERRRALGAHSWVHDFRSTDPAVAAAVSKLGAKESRLFRSLFYPVRSLDMVEESTPTTTVYWRRLTGDGGYPVSYRRATLDHTTQTLKVEETVQPPERVLARIRMNERESLRRSAPELYHVLHEWDGRSPLK